MLVDLVLVEPGFVSDAGYLVCSQERSVYFPATVLVDSVVDLTGRAVGVTGRAVGATEEAARVTEEAVGVVTGNSAVTGFRGTAAPLSCDAGELLTQLLFRTHSLLSSASFVVAVSNRLALTARARPLTQTETHGWGKVAERFHNLTGNPAFICRAAYAERSDLQEVVYAAAHFLYTVFGGSNARVDTFLSRVASPPWRVPHGSWFWRTLMAVISAAEITVLDEAVVHYRSKWGEGTSTGKSNVDTYVNIA